MRNLNKLEAKWRFYKYKQFAPYIIFLLFGIIFTTYYFLSDSGDNQKKIDYKLLSSDSTEDVILKEEPLAVHGNFNLLEPEIVRHLEIRKQICVSKPIFELKSSEKEKNKSVELNKTISTSEDIGNKDIFSKPQNQEVCLDLPIETKDNLPVAHKKIKFDTIDSVDAIGDIMRRFNHSKDPNDALFLANNFYESGDYSKALYWAIETNKITEDIEEGWLLMAKSKAKLGDKNEAIRILRAYSSKKISTEALDLAKSIESDEWN